MNHKDAKAERISKAFFVLLLCFSAAYAAELTRVQLTAKAGDPQYLLKPAVPWQQVPGTIDPILAQHARQAYADDHKGRPYPWELRPEIYGFTAPPRSYNVRFPAEFESPAALMIGWPSYLLDHAGKSRIRAINDVIRHSVSRIPVVIFTPAENRNRVQDSLASQHISTNSIEIISFPRQFPDQEGYRTVDTIWIRDYGPQFLYSSVRQQQNTFLIDMSYHPVPWFFPSRPEGRPRDDALPTRLAGLWKVPVFRPPLAGEGGKLLTDGNGVCFLSERLVKQNRAIFGESHNAARVLKDFQVCRRTVVLRQLSDEPTGDIDMFMTVLSKNQIVIGKYSASQDPKNARILDRNAERLRKLGYEVTRIPMPEPYEIAGRRIWATYTNAIRIRGAILVPVYRNRAFPEHLQEKIQRQEVEALNVYRSAVRNIEIIPIEADSLISLGGALHCIALGIPSSQD